MPSYHVGRSHPLRSAPPRALQLTDARVAVVDLSRNFGKEIALTADRDHCHGDATVIIDVDLQDPPEVIPQLVAQWQAGYDDVYAQRLEREGESWLKRATSYAFYRVVKRMGRVEIPEDTGDFRLLSRRAVTSLLKLREQHRFMKGLYRWVGYPSAAVPYQRRRGGPARPSGTTGSSGTSRWTVSRRFPSRR
jgi:polyisoprenyl-phosphate glycosyltransferase